MLNSDDVGFKVVGQVKANASVLPRRVLNSRDRMDVAMVKDLFVGISNYVFSVCQEM